MHGEILFSDVERFGVLKDLVDADLKDHAAVRPGGQEPHRAFQAHQHGEADG